MKLDCVQLESLLCEGLCARVRVHRHSDDVLMLDSPFTFPDGDHVPVYFSETASGGVKLSDHGHTLMHVSDDHDVDSLFAGARATLREQIVPESGTEEDQGSFSLETPPDQAASAHLRFGQALTKTYDLTFPGRDRVSSTFYEDRRILLFTLLDEESVSTDYIPPGIPDGNSYPVDFHFDGKEGRPVFLYCVPGRDKARLTSIMLSHFLLNGLTFEFVIVFADQQEIPRFDLARLTNLYETGVASLDPQEDLSREIRLLAA